jgi:nucleoside phosphorylase
VILAATGLQREARIIARPGVIAVAGGGDAERLERTLEARVAGARAVLSVGLAGALADGLKPGDWVIGTRLSFPPPFVSSAVETPFAGLETSLDCARDERKVGATEATWLTNLQALLPEARTGPIHADGTMITTAAAKRALYAATGAIAADMESHIAARVAARHGLPFAIVRVISDAADRDLPRAVQVGMKKDGNMAPGAVMLALIRDPRQLPALIRTALDAERGFRSLLRGYDMLAGVGFGLPDLGKLPLDMT